MSVHWTIIRSLLTAPLRTIVHDDRRSYRGIDLLVASIHVAEAIDRATSRPHVGLLLPTSGAFPISMLGAWGLGKVIVPLNYLLKPDELDYVIQDSGIDTIVTVQPMLDFLDRAPAVEKLIRLEDLDFKSAPSPRLPAFVDDDNLAALVYTSGTSGKPKGVMLSHAALKANARQGAKGLGLGKRDKMIGVLPQFHCYGLTQLTLTPLLHGVVIIYTARFVPRRLLELMATHQATVAVAIPSMLNAMANVKNVPEGALDHMRMVVSGSEPLPEAVFQRFREKFGFTLSEGYGMTEMSPATHCSLIGKPIRKSVGPPLPGVLQRIVDPATEAEQPTGSEGEIRLTGPNVMSGYWRLPDKAAEAFDAEGYYKTGDRGRIDAEGNLYITGRIKEMMIIGGENVFPREIEEALESHPIVHAAGCTSQADEVRGEIPIAFVELAEDADPAAYDERDLIAHCRERLAGYKAPRRVIRVDALPRNPTGKILRKELPAMLEAVEQGEPASA